MSRSEMTHFASKTMLINCEHPSIIINPKFQKIVKRTGIFYDVDKRQHFISPHTLQLKWDYYTFSAKRLGINHESLDTYYTHDADGVIVPAWIQVPCNKCPICRKRKATDYACRAVAESQTSTSVPLFVTLTYDDKHLPADMCVSVDVVQKFLKRLRRILDAKGVEHKLRYFACGEYGKHSGRPHYHLLIWNYPYDEELTSCGIPLCYQAHPDILSAWSLKGNPFGYVYVKTCNVGGIHYVMKYMRKDCTTTFGRTPCFYLSSRGSGGIGSQYFKEHLLDYYLNNPQDSEISILDKFSQQTFHCTLPKYFRELMFKTSTFIKPSVRTAIKEFKALCKYRYALARFSARACSNPKSSAYHPLYTDAERSLLQHFDCFVPLYRYESPEFDYYHFLIKHNFRCLPDDGLPVRSRLENYVNSEYKSTISKIDGLSDFLKQNLPNKEYYLYLQRVKALFNDFLASKHVHDVIDADLIKYRVNTIVKENLKTSINEIL